MTYERTIPLDELSYIQNARTLFILAMKYGDVFFARQALNGVQKAKKQDIDHKKQQLFQDADYSNTPENAKKIRAGLAAIFDLTHAITHPIPKNEIGSCLMEALVNLEPFNHLTHIKTVGFKRDNPLKNKCPLAGTTTTENHRYRGPQGICFFKRPE